VTLGIEVEEPVVVSDIAAPLGAHSNAVDRIATAEGARKLDDNLMTISLPNPGRDVPSRPTDGITHSELPTEGGKHICQ
jgi:hypothetical protein